MLPPVFPALKASASVRAIVGTSPARIYRHGAAPQGLTLPYITWTLVSSVPENNLSDLPPTDRQTVQIDCWHQNSDDIDTLATAVRDAIEPIAHMTSTLLDEQEPETKLYRIGLQFDFWGR